jgi:hypothetical protein
MGRAKEYRQSQYQLPDRPSELPINKEATMIGIVSRRRLLQFLTASPYFAQAALAEGLRPPDPVDWAPRDLDKLISDPRQALDVFDFEPVMKKNVPPAHFGYMATGTDVPSSPNSSL